MYSNGMGATLNSYTVKLKVIGPMPPDTSSRASELRTSLHLLNSDLPEPGTEFEVNWADRNSKEAARKAVKQYGTDRRLELEVVSVSCKKRRF